MAAHSMTCPDEEHLADFVDGRLQAAERDTVATHVEACDTCFDVVVLTRAAVEEERALAGAPFPVTAAQRAARERARALYSPPLSVRAVFRLVRDALDLVREAGAQWTPVAAPAVRGGEAGDGRDLWQARVRVDDLDLALEVERSGEGAVIAAGLTGADGAEAPAGTSVALVREGSLLAFQPATAEPADLAEVGPGEFRVEVRRDGEVAGHAIVALEEVA